MTPPPFLFIRHGETDWNLEGRLQGGRDIPMNARGRAQATAAGGRLAALLQGADCPPEAARFVVSPLGRTRETAERVRIAVGLPAGGYAVDERLQEFSFGLWEGMTWGEVKRHDPLRVRARRRDKWRFVPPGGESYEQLAARIRPWLATVTDNLVVVSHGGVARALMVLVGGVPEPAAAEADVFQGRVLRFADGRSAWQ